VTVSKKIGVCVPLSPEPEVQHRDRSLSCSGRRSSWQERSIVIRAPEPPSGPTTLVRPESSPRRLPPPNRLLTPSRACKRGRRDDRGLRRAPRARRSSPSRSSSPPTGKREHRACSPRSPTRCSYGHVAPPSSSTASPGRDGGRHGGARRGQRQLRRGRAGQPRQGAHCGSATAWPRRRARYVVSLDADGQYDAAEIPRCSSRSSRRG